MAVNIDKEDLKDYLKLCNEKVAKNVEIVTKEQIGAPVLLHIAMDKRKILVPNISKRAEPHEDNTLPRVHVAATLEDCMIGYNGIADVVLSNPIRGKGDDPIEKEHASQADWLGGFYIHAVEYEVALKPNTKLVPQVRETNELWLVPYCKMYNTYKGEVIGKMVISRMDYAPTVGDLPSLTMTVALEVSGDTPVVLNSKLTLNKGCWEIKVKDNKVVTHRPIAKDAFAETKTVTASMLSMEEQSIATRPKFLRR